MANTRVRNMALMLGVVVVAVVVVARSGDDRPSGNDGASITPIEILSATPAASGDRALPVIELTGFSMPIGGGCLPNSDQLMPNAPRLYRHGIHEGVDFYGVDNCTTIVRGTNVLAAREGTVVRADHAYVDITQADVDRFNADPGSEGALDSYRGRQVWIEHGVDATGQKIVTRYAHLSGIAPGITAGASVAKGQLVGFVGESGTPESISNPGLEMHLHFELRVGDTFLGNGLPPAQVRALYVALFTPRP